ncbi:hypothetical protein F5B21DRAFT_515156 [Xylaria acuta]|nr:hypothetical protein F5B21DRAFT_515156 [Xylaria acuta]
MADSYYSLDLIEESRQLRLEPNNSGPKASTIASQATVEHAIGNEASQDEVTVGEVPRPAPTSPSTSTKTLSRGARGPDGDAVNAPRAWRAITLRWWMPQATTLTALLVRVIAAAQATKRKVQKSQVAQFSVMRGINNGPLKLLMLMLPSRQIMLHFEPLLVFASTLSTVSLQFSTTILLSDIFDGTITGDKLPFRVKHYITSKDEAPVNAIYRERSFLSFDKQQNRTTVRHFEGNVVTMNTRVVCVHPEIKGSYKAKILNPLLGSRSVKTGRINGTWHYGKGLRDTHSNSTLLNSEGCQSTSFDCSMPAGVGESSDYQSAFCSVTIVDGEYWNGTGSIGHSMVQLVYSNNVPSSEWPLLVESRKLADAPRTDYGEWSSFELLPGRFLNISLCFSTFNIHLQYLDMTADGQLHEPSENWSLIGIGDSTAVRTYLGTNPSHPSPDERGILTTKSQRQPEINSTELGDSGNWANKTLQTWLNFQEALYIPLTRSTGGIDPTWQGCNTCYTSGATMHPDLSMVIGDNLEATGRAAELMQSFITVFSLILYTESYKALEGTIEVHVSFLEIVQLPQQCSETGCKGLVSVASLPEFHLICVLLTSVLFIRQVRCSRQGNIWHTVSQLMGDELGDILGKGNNTNDETIAKFLKEEGTDALVKLEECDRSLIGFIHVSNDSQNGGVANGSWSRKVPGGHVNLRRLNLAVSHGCQ